MHQNYFSGDRAHTIYDIFIPTVELKFDKLSFKVRYPETGQSSSMTSDRRIFVFFEPTRLPIASPLIMSSLSDL